MSPKALQDLSPFNDGPTCLFGQAQLFNKEKGNLVASFWNSTCQSITNLPNLLDPYDVSHLTSTLTITQ